MPSQRPWVTYNEMRISLLLVLRTYISRHAEQLVSKNVQACHHLKGRVQERPLDFSAIFESA